MKVTLIDGSHHAGTTSTIVDEIMIKLGEYCAKVDGMEIKRINLRGLHIDYCGGTGSRRAGSVSCFSEDGMRDISRELESADRIALCSPTYFSNVSARMKNMMDRCNPYWRSGGLKGKKAYLIGAGGFIKSTETMLKIMREFCRILGIVVIGSHPFVAETKHDITGDEKINKELEEIAAKIVA